MKFYCRWCKKEIDKQFNRCECEDAKKYWAIQDGTYLTSNHNQQKKDKDDGSNVSLSGTPKQLQGKTNKDEHMLVSVDKHVDTDNLRNPVLDAVTPLEGCRINPQDDPGKASGADNGGTGDGTFPADSNSKAARKILKRLRLRNR